MPTDGPSARLEAGARLARVAAQLHARGFLQGTSGNLSAVLGREPLRLCISPSGADKGALRAEQFLLVDEGGRALDGVGKPSDETGLHLAIYARRPAAAVLHTHSVWATLLSERHADEGGLRLEGYEMLKGLAGVRTHAHAEWLPILENSQDYAALSAEFGATLEARAEAHGVLLRGHGLYTWGRDLDEARRHVEVLEFLFEVVGRSGAATSRSR